MKVLDNGIYRDMTEEELKAYQEGNEQTTESKIAELKQMLADSDYKAIKYAEGLISDEEYEPIRAQRQEWRNQINILEESL
jgi:flagellin-specific chaperone FliS